MDVLNKGVHLRFTGMRLQIFETRALIYGILGMDLRYEMTGMNLWNKVIDLRNEGAAWMLRHSLLRDKMNPPYYLWEDPTDPDYEASKGVVA